jgi:hypothetical protein
MTRLALLLSYPLNNRRDTWLSFGGANIDNSPKVFFRNALFRLVAPAVPLNGAIVFVNDDYTLPAGFDWVRMQIADPTSPSGDIVDTTTGIISPYFNVVLTQTQFNSITQDYDPTFIPFQEPDASSRIAISEHDLDLILNELGVPFITLEELEFDRDRIANLMVYPAVREYYKFFPIMTVSNHPLSNNQFSVPIPPDPVFTALDARVIPGVPVSQSGITNPITFFFDEVLMNVAGGANGGFTTPGYATNRRRGTQAMTNISTTVLERAVRSGIVNYSQRSRVRISIQEGKVTGYSTLKGTLQITWGSWSPDFNGLPYNRQSEVRQLATAYALRAFGMLRSQANSTIPGTIKYESFLSRADKMEERIVELWQKSTKSAIVRLG